MERFLFDRFARPLLQFGAAATRRPEFVIASDDRYSIRYTPFEQINATARLVIVGITPGPNQLDEAYRETQRLLRLDVPRDQLLRDIKKAGAFGGASMRPNLVRMLRHFRFADALGIDDEASLWSANAHLFHATSVIPHAAFRRDRKFAGSFEEIRQSRVLWECFWDCFASTLPQINPSALYVGLGPTVEAALTWCVSEGLLSARQVLGSFPHPSTESGSQVDYFLKRKTLSDLSPKDPVRNRTKWLDEAYQQLSHNMQTLTLQPGAIPPSDRRPDRNMNPY